MLSIYSFKKLSIPVACLLAFAIAAASSNASVVLPLRSVAYGTSYNVEIQFGDQTLPVIVDTGSADLWVLSSDWECFYGKQTANGEPVSKDECKTGSQIYTESSTFTPIDWTWIGVHYGASNVYGTLGFEDIKIGGITVPQQITGVINATTSYNDNFNAGILGLGYPTITQIQPANYTGDTDLELLQDRLLYPTILQTMAKEGVEPYFALAIERTPLDQEIGFGGYLSFGVLPPLAHGPFTIVPVEYTDAIPNSFTNGTRTLTEWTLTVHSISWDGQTSEKPFQAVLDSAQWLNVFPKALAEEINAAFNPQGVLKKGEGTQQTAYAVDCDAVPPANFGIQLGGTMFTLDPADMIFRDDSGQCYSTVSPVEPQSGITVLFLGYGLLKNVVAVFDYGENEMRFAKREGGRNATTSSGPPIVPSNGAVAPLAASLVTITAALAVSFAVGI